MEADAGAVPEVDLLRRARQGEWEAFEELVQQYQGRVFALAMRVAGQRQDAEDVVQQTFLTLLEHLDQLREDDRLSAWILRVATNHALKVLRKKRGLPLAALPREDAPADSYADLPHPNYIAHWRENPEALAERAEVRDLIEKALAHLDDRYRLVFILRDIEGLSTHETAEALGISEANAKVRLLRARLVLRERLTEALGDETTRMFPSHAHE